MRAAARAEHQAAQAGAGNVLQPRKVEHERLAGAHRGVEVRGELGAERLAVLVVEPSFREDGAGVAEIFIVDRHRRRGMGSALF